MKKFTLLTILLLIITLSNITTGKVFQENAKYGNFKDKYRDDNEDYNYTFNPFRKATRTPSRFSISVGLDRYSNRPLRTCVNDAKIMRKIFINKMHFKAVNTRLLLNSMASKTMLIKYFRNIKKIATKNDFFIFYYSGHGIKTRSYGTSTTALLLTTGERITSAEFARMISGIKAYSLFIFDACYAAGMITGDFIENVKNTSGSYSIRNNYFFIASSTPYQISMTIPRIGYSRFTYFFHKGIYNGTADINRDGRITLLEAFRWAKSRTINYGLRHGRRHDPVIAGSSPNNVILNSSINPGSRGSRIAINNANRTQRNNQRNNTPNNVNRRNNRRTWQRNNRSYNRNYNRDSTEGSLSSRRNYSTHSDDFKPDINSSGDAK